MTQEFTNSVPGDGATLHRLFAFHKIVSAGSVSAYSRQTKLTPAKVHHLIHSIESSVGELLVIKNRGYIELTPFGKKFCGFAREIYEHYYKTMDFVEPEEVACRMIVSATHGAAKLFVPSVIVEYKKIYPEDTFQILCGAEFIHFEETNCDLYVGPALSNRIDLFQSSIKSYCYGFFASDEYIKTHPKIETVEDLKFHNFLILKGFLPITEKALGKYPDILYEATNYDAIIPLAQKHQGIISLPLGESCYDYHGLTRILPHYKSESEQMMVGYKKYSTRPKRVQLFCELIQELYGEETRGRAANG
jgi:DNA-binding transcriptional LysR family regulator